MTIKKNEGHTIPENMRSASAEHFDALRSWNTLERRPRHCTLDFHTKVQVWGKSLSVSLQVPTLQRVSLFQEGVRPSFLKKKRDEKKRKRKKKREREKKEEKKTEREKKKRERKKERVREPWLHTLKQLTHTNH